MINSNINYSGRIKIKIKGKPPVKRHNNGTEQFFNLLYSCLSLQITPLNTQEYMSRLPNYISIVLMPTEEVVNKKTYSDFTNDTLLLKSPMPICDRTNNLQKVSLTSVLTSSNIEKIKYDATSRATLLLLDSTFERNILAYAEFNLDAIGDVATSNYSNQADIIWEMSFSNASTIS